MRAYGSARSRRNRGGSRAGYASRHCVWVERQRLRINAREVVPPTGDAKLANGFTLPSRNIFCAWRITKLRCEIGSGLQPPTAECPHETGLDAPPTLMTITRARAGPRCTADIFAPVGLPTLAYGKVWRFHGILCLSQESGLVCVNQAGRGFFLSRERWAEF